MYIMCVCLFSALSSRAGALQIVIYFYFFIVGHHVTGQIRDSKVVNQAGLSPCPGHNEGVRRD